MTLPENQSFGAVRGVIPTVGFRFCVGKHDLVMFLLTLLEDKRNEEQG